MTALITVVALVIGFLVVRALIARGRSGRGAETFSRQQQFVIGQVASMTTQLNDSVRIAASTKCDQTRSSRIALAKDRIAALKRIEQENSFVKLSGIDGVESQIEELENPANLYALVEALGATSWYLDAFTSEDRDRMQARFSSVAGAMLVAVVSEHIARGAFRSAAMRIAQTFSVKDMRTYGVRWVHFAQDLQHRLVLDHEQVHFELLEWSKTALAIGVTFPESIPYVAQWAAIGVEISDKVAMLMRSRYPGVDLPQNPHFEHLIRWEIEGGALEAAMQLAKAAQDQGWQAPDNADSWPAQVTSEAAAAPRRRKRWRIPS